VFLEGLELLKETFSATLPEIHLINPRLPCQELKPIISRNPTTKALNFNLVLCDHANHHE
jgi:hypothetical protein